MMKDEREDCRYGVPIDGNAVKMIYSMRAQRLKARVSISDRCLVSSLFLSKE